MKYASIVLAAIMFLVAPLALNAQAREEAKGTVSRVNSSEIVLEMRNRSTRTFDLSRDTRVFIMGEPYSVKRISKGSKARVVREKGKVTAVYVEEAPK